MSEALHGTVVLVVGARTYTLQPTLEAALRIEHKFGGLRGALEATRLLSLSACADLIVAGAGLKPEQHAEIAAAIFTTGVSTVANALVPYISGLISPVPPDIAARGKPEAAATAP